MSLSDRFSSVSKTIGQRPLATASVIVVIILLAGLFVTGTVRFPSQATPMDFALRQKVSASSVLKMSFPALMDHGSTESSMTVPEGVKGTWSWQDETLLFTPSAPLTAGQTIVFRLSHSAEKSDGKALQRDLDFTFIVAGPPSIAVRIPEAGARNVSANSKITIVFDRPMIPLTQVQGEAANARLAHWSTGRSLGEGRPVTISPDLSGRWRWLSTVAVEFIPEKSLMPGTRYTVTIPEGIQTVSGDSTQEDFSWTFETERPQIVSSTPVQGDMLSGPSTVLSLTFNQEMDSSVAANFLSLKGSEKRRNSLEDVEIGSITSGTKEGEDKKKVKDLTTLVITPKQKWEFNHDYTLKVAPGIKGAKGNLGNESGFTLNFSTVGAFATQSAKLEYGLVVFTMNNPISEESLKNQITVSPAVEGWKDVAWTVSSWDLNGRAISAYPPLAPSTSYTITLGTGIADTFGQKLQEPYTYTFKTDPLPPQLLLESKGEFGIFEREKPPVYRLESVNISKVEAQLSSISLQDFLVFRGSQSTWNELPTGRTPLKTWTYTPKSDKDTWDIHPMDLSKEARASLGSGLYALLVRAPNERETDGREIRSTQIFALTNTALTLKYSGNRALVWAVDMRTGAPVSGANITFHTLMGETPVTGLTDKEGFFETEIDLKKFVTPQNEWEPEFWVTAEKGQDFAFVSSRWNDGIRPDTFGYGTDFWNAQDRAERIHSSLYTERPIYRAGDTVDFKGILRIRNREGVLSLPQKDRKVNVLVTDANGNEVLTKTLPLSEFGSFADSFPIDAKASLGTYSLSAGFPESPYGDAFVTFEVLAYRKPEYRVDLTAEKEEIFDGDTAKVTIEGAYYFGAPMGGAKVQWRAQLTDYFFNKVRDGWYSFGLEDNWCFSNCQRETKLLAEGEGQLDASGHLTIAVPASIADKAVSQILTVEADVSDPNNQVASNRVSIPVHKANAYVGVRSEDWAVAPGTDAKIAVLTVKPDGSPLPNTSVTVNLYARKWNTIKKKGVDGEYTYDNTPEDTFLKASKVTTDEKGKAVTTVRIDQGGEFRVVAVVQDDQGREAKAGTSLYAWSSTYVNWPHENNNRIDVVPDKPEYQIGDTAVLLIKSPFQGENVKALVTVEREQVISRKVIVMESAAQKIEVPITEDLTPTAFVSVLIIKPRIGETFDENGLDAGTPAFRIGYAKLPVETTRKRLTVSIEPDKEKYLPGEKVTVTIKAADYLGKPVRAELSLGVVDMSLLALSGFELPDLVEQFYGERAIGVLTSEMLTYVIDRYKPGSKGGGGAELEAKRRGNFKDTAYWNPTILTNDQGEAIVSFTLPDNLTTWNLLAIGQTKASTFGAAEKTVVSTKHVIVRPVRPRFAVTGDRVTLGAIVGNFLDEPAAFSVSLTGSGFTLSGEKTQEVSLAAGEQKKITFPVTITRTTKATFTFLAQNLPAEASAKVGASGRDEVVESIPVLTYGTPQSAATTGFTEDSTTEKILVPSERDARDGSLSVSVSPSLATYLPSGLQYLAEYPYGCAEQTLSAVLPSALLFKLQGFDAFHIMDRKTLEKMVTAGLERLYTFQRGDGGFGFWQDSTRSYPYLSAYVLEALDLIRSAGFSVDESVISRTRQYLDQSLRDSNSDRQLDLAMRAYILYVLGETGKVDISLLKNLDEQRAKLPTFAKAHLAMAFDRANSKSKARDILTEIFRSARVDARGTHFEEEAAARYSPLMHTNDRTSALVLSAMLRIDPKNALIPNVVRYLLAIRKDGHWDTTQSTVSVLMAFIDELKATNELDANFTAGIQVNDTKILDWKVNKENILSRKQITLALAALLRGEESTVKIGKVGTGRLYYDLVLSYFYTADELPPAEEGISILRTVTPMPGQKKELTVGNTYRVTLTVTVPEDRHFVAVESPLPAGMEPVDLSLATAQKTLLEDDTTQDWSEEYWQSGNWRFTHREYRDDMFFAFADELPAGVYQLTYLARATTPGTFHERPARVYEMYFPEVFGQTTGKMVTIQK